MGAIRKAANIIGTIFFTFFLVTVFFFLTTTRAKAPKGGKNSLGGRTIATIQEEDFDQRITNYQLCYGIKFSAGNATVERRRVCKAMLVHQLDLAFKNPGAVLKNPIEFYCADTAFGKNEWESDGVQSVALKPNAEYKAIEIALQKNLEIISISVERDLRLRQACIFLNECKSAMKAPNFSFRKIGHCLATKDALHRTILVDSLSSIVFRDQSVSQALYAKLAESSSR